MPSLVSTYFKYFLTETATGLIYYLDENGNLQKGSIMSGNDYSLPEEPDGWADFQLMYARNMTYWGINRSFSVPLKFVGDGARIIRNLFYLGRGPEQPITMTITKYDETQGAFVLYYAGQLDLSQTSDLVAESITVNIMEGGILQLLKSYADTIVELPCNGSIPENVKFLADGVQFSDTFTYQITQLTAPFPSEFALPLTFVSNDGDNIAVIHGDQGVEQPYANYLNKSGNYLFSTQSPVSLRIYGSISVQSDPSVHNTAFYMYAATSASQPIAGGYATHAVGLVLPQNQIQENTQAFKPAQSTINLDGQRTFSFDETLEVGANENVFIMIFNNFSSNPIRILGGTVNLAFNSQLKASRVWGIQVNNVWKLLGQALCSLASTTDYPFAYPFESEFLEGLQRFIVTSGDAVRASTDPNYAQFYNEATLNPANPNNQTYSQYTTQGPVIKMSLSDLFGSLNPIKPSSIGNLYAANNTTNAIFFESRDYVLDTSEVTVALGEVNNLTISGDNDNYFNWLEIGYTPNDSDTASGKYEYNNTSQFQAPVKTLRKAFQLTSKKGRTDSYGFEFTRYNQNGGNSTTTNGSDSDWWFINCDMNNYIYDFYSAIFTSTIQNTANNIYNTNLTVLPNLNYQGVLCNIIDGEYFVNGNDFSIFMLNRPTVDMPSGGVGMSIDVSFNAFLNGLAGDSATINFYKNGVLMQSWTQSINSVNTVLAGTFNTTYNAALGDNFYFTVSTVRTCTVQINAFSLNVGAGYFIAQNAGPINYAAGVTQQLVSLPLITGVTYTAGSATYQVVSYGFQYFRFLSPIAAPTFNWAFMMQGLIQGNTSQTMEIDLWKNGIKVGSVIYNSTSAQTTWNPTATPQFTGTDTYNLYDMYWLTVSAGNTGAFITSINMTWTSTNVKAYLLLRMNGQNGNPAYSNVSGIPNPYWMFNTEDFTPMRMLQANGSILRSMLYMIGPGQLAFQTASKNQFLSTTLNGNTITENSSPEIQDLGAPLWLPLYFEFDTAVPWTAAQLFNASANGYISFMWKGKTFYGFPIQITIKPAMNDTQHWKLLAAPTNNLSDLVNLEWDGLTQLQLMDSVIPIINPVHFLPANFTKPAKYNTYTMDEDWFVNRIQDYCDRNNYFAPWQTTDTISMQCQTAGLAPVTVQILNGRGIPVGAALNCYSPTGAAVQAPQQVWQVDIPLANLTPGKYYMLWTMGTGPATAVWISEGIWIKPFWPKTQLYEYTNSRNKLGAIFLSNTPWTPAKRFFSQINKFKPGMKATTYVDEPQDITLLNGIPYRTWNLDAGFGSGMPDYDIDIISRIWGLDGVYIDGNQYSRDADANMDITYVDGEAKGYVKLAIRQAVNSDYVGQNTSGQITGPQQAGYVIDSQAFGGGNGQQFINITRTES